MPKTIQGNFPILEFSTLSEMVNAKIKVGQKILLKERISGNKGGGTWDCVLTSSVIPNTYDIVISVADATNSFVLRDDEPMKTSQLGILTDGTDQTTQLVAFFDSLADPTRKTYEISVGTSFNRTSVIASIPKWVTVFDKSGYDFDSTNETVRKYGVIDFGSTDGSSDTHWSVESAHHAIIELNNHGNSGSLSSTERKGSLVWGVGTFQQGVNDKRGYRSGAIDQFTKSSVGNFWIRAVRSNAPWLAIAADYERWATGQSATSGVTYTLGQDNIYVAASTGTTGATIPSHTSGTVSDGGVDWTWVDSSDRSVFIYDQYGRFLIGSGSFVETFRHKVNETDPGGGDYLMQLLSTGVSKRSELRLTPTDSGGTNVGQPYLRGQDGSGLRMMKSDGTTDIGAFTDTGFLMRGNRRLVSAISDGDTTPSVDNLATIVTANTSATSITAFDDGEDGQRVEIFANDTNTTLVSSSTFLLAGSVNLVMGQWDVVTMMKVPNSISNRWIEVSRSIK